MHYIKQEFEIYIQSTQYFFLHYPSSLKFSINNKNSYNNDFEKISIEFDWLFIYSVFLSLYIDIQLIEYDEQKKNHEIKI